MSDVRSVHGRTTITRMMLISKVAKEQSCLFINVLAANRGTDLMVHYDGCHANDLGHQIIANRIFEVCPELLMPCKEYKGSGKIKPEMA